MESRDALKKYLAYSLSFHLFVFILFVLFGQIAPPPPKESTQVVMLRISRKTGSQASPLLKKTGTESPPPPVKTAAPAPVPPQPAKPPTPAAPPQPAKPAVPAPKKPEVISVKKPVTPPQPATPPQKPAPAQPAAAPAKPPGPDEQKIAEALAGVKGELEQREATQNQPPAAAAPGTEGTPGTGSPFGSPGGTVDAADPQIARYQGQVRSKIIREWIRTNSGTEGDPLRSRVVVRINASGNVISTSFAKRSGDASFDMSAVRAIERASPLPPPPEVVMGEALNEGFVIDFSSRMLGRSN